jgi:hypothetical protein
MIFRRRPRSAPNQRHDEDASGSASGDAAAQRNAAEISGRGGHTSGYVYWGSGTATCEFGADSDCAMAHPERKHDTTQFTAHLDESEAKDSEALARGSIAMRARNKAHKDHDCWHIRSMEFDIKRKQVGR